MDSEKVNDLKICLKSIIICYIPNAVPVSRILKLTGFILGDKDAELLKKYGVQEFVEDHLREQIAVINVGREYALVHDRCKDGNA
ncbi:hypothetical protein M3Y97_00601800 [Aphelenchoides bicaudatus]|nr:hypothetical protein M3Y97_00601800 [Aphelenchoides bicaudatus]